MSHARLLAPLAPLAMCVALGAFAFTMGAGATGPTFTDAGPPDDSSTTFDLGGPEISTCSDNFADVCAPNGNPGCAGGGGSGGSGGQGGGATVALLAIGTTTVTVTNGAFVMGHGGTGGPGGAGEDGGAGVDGGSGFGVQCKGACPSCSVFTTLSGGQGGGGTTGGPGGQGGGGAGGPAYYYVTLGAATVDASAATITASQPGIAGVHGNPNGVDGQQGVHP